MDIISFVHEGLGNSSYIVDLGAGAALLVDPDRSVDRYRTALENRGLVVAGVLETHLHADFISGVRELADLSGAPAFLSEEARSHIPHRAIRPGSTLTLPGAEVAVIGSPGHTPEHVSFAVRIAGAPPALFSGGSLLVGGAARTDLISPDMTDTLSRAQFTTLHQAFAGLPDETLLLPTHGGGSFCSTGSGGERSSTLGRERRENPLLAMNDVAEFVRWFPTTFPAAPDYFFRMRQKNQAGPRLRREIEAPRLLNAGEFASAIEGAVVVDIRSKEEYARGHIPGSINNTLRDVYAVWLGWLVPDSARLLFIGDYSELPQTVSESLLVGYEEFAGWLDGGIAAWEQSGRPVATIELADAGGARHYLLSGAMALDVREPDEYREGHLPEAQNIPLGMLGRSLPAVPSDRPIVVYCGHGERASTAASILEQAGRSTIVNLDGGAGAWQNAGFPMIQSA